MDVKQAIERRRAFRSLSPVQITEELVAELAGAAQLCASCYNKQPWRYVFVYDPETLRKMCDTLAQGNEWAKQASMMVAVFTRRDLDCVYQGREYFMFDTGMATAFVILRATELGLVAHPIAGFDEQKTKDLLGIPDDMLVITLLIVGKRAKKISPLLSGFQLDSEKERPMRLPLSQIAFNNSFKPSGL